MADGTMLMVEAVGGAKGRDSLICFDGFNPCSPSRRCELFELPLGPPLLCALAPFLGGNKKSQLFVQLRLDVHLSAFQSNS